MYFTNVLHFFHSSSPTLCTSAEFSNTPDGCLWSSPETRSPWSPVGCRGRLTPSRCGSVTKCFSFKESAEKLTDCPRCRVGSGPRAPTDSWPRGERSSYCRSLKPCEDLIGLWPETPSCRCCPPRQETGCHACALLTLFPLCSQCLATIGPLALLLYCCFLCYSHLCCYQNKSLM